MATATTLKAFILQDLPTQYADLLSDGVLVRKESRNYRDKSENYTFLGSEFIVEKKSGVVQKVLIDCALVPPLV